MGNLINDAKNQRFIQTTFSRCILPTNGIHCTVHYQKQDIEWMHWSVPGGVIANWKNEFYEYIIGSEQNLTGSASLDNVAREQTLQKTLAKYIAETLSRCYNRNLAVE